MTPLVTIEEACEQLRIDGTADDPWLIVMIPAITAAVVGWLKDPLRAYETEEDSNGERVLVEDSNGDNINRQHFRNSYGSRFFRTSSAGTGSSRGIHE